MNKKDFVMNLDLENFFKENSLKKYYRFTDDIMLL